jgi:hypothetical protein
VRVLVRQALLRVCAECRDHVLDPLAVRNTYGASLSTVAMMSSPWKRVKAVLGRASRWTLVSVVLGFALIGFLQVTRGIAVHHVEGIGADGVPIGVSESQFPLVATMLTGASLAQGHRVEVTLNGDGTYPRLWGGPPIRAAIYHAAAVLRRARSHGADLG